ncbi:fam-l protein [Plasmodium malariae]|uniref:Fam-l protein n=1 Tax=Plasmodium malariae TaxID=5858 RepID=A0A1D3JLU1_PLAMA|nr:fam-l protein [Plasmodium malariae]SBT87564.1 fam-l protein [Plasmodium malariae]
MEQKLRLFLFTKISTFILLSWICYFFNDINCLNKNLDEKWNLCRKLNIRIYRILAKYKHYKDSSNSNQKEEMQISEVKKEENIYNNKKGTNGKHKKSCRNSLYNGKYGKNIEKNISGIPKTKKYSIFEKKIFKELYYEDYVKNIKSIEYEEYKKLARRKRRIRIALLLLFFMVLAIPILDISLEKITEGGLLGLLHLLYPTGNDTNPLSGIEGHLDSLLSQGTWNILGKICASTTFIYGVPFLIFVVIFILGMVYYYKKVIKYENTKFRKKLNLK